MRIRIKMPTGAEFEAEGPESFILTEKQKFLTTFYEKSIDKTKDIDTEANGLNSKNYTPLPQAYTPENTNNFAQNSISSQLPEELPFQQNYANTPQIFKKTNINDIDGIILEENGEWAKLTKMGKEGFLILRTRANMQIDDAALILLAAEYQVNKREAIAALSLTKMLKSSGFQPNRLDRDLKMLIAAGLLRYEGTKRNRHYLITKAGFQKAALLAHKHNTQTIQEQ